MNRAEEILYSHSSNSITKHPNKIRTEVLAAMDQYARERSIAFMEWAIENNWEWSASRRFRGESAIWYKVGEEGHLTHEQLFDLSIQSKNDNQ